MLDKLIEWEMENQDILNELYSIASQLETSAESIKAADEAAAADIDKDGAR